MGLLQDGQGQPVTGMPAQSTEDPGATLPQGEAPPAEEQAAPPAESEKYTALAGRHANLERTLREERLGRKQEAEKLQALTEKFTALETQLKENPFELLEQNGHTYDKWTERMLQKTPEQEAASREQQLQEQIEALKARVDERESARTQERDERARDETLSSLRQVVGEREDLAYIGKLGQEPILYQRLAEYQEKYGECPPEIQEELSLALEAESREVVAQNLEALSAVPHFKELILGLAKKLGAESDAADEQASPADGESQGQANGNGARTPSSLTQTQASAVTERKAPNNKRTRAERRQALLEKLDARQQHRR